MKKTPIKKAEEYLQKAKDILSDTPIIYDNFYADIKNIKKAAKTAWKGCITALDYVLFYKNPYEHIDPYNKQAYIDLLYEIDKKFAWVYDSAYNLLNYAMICDGSSSIVVCNDAIRCAEEIIEWCKKIESGVEQYKKEQELAYAEYLKKKKSDEKIIKKQSKELLELLLYKNNLTKKDLLESACRHFIVTHIDDLTPEEKKRFDRLVFD